MKITEDMHTAFDVLKSFNEAYETANSADRAMYEALNSGWNGLYTQEESEIIFKARAVFRRIRNDTNKFAAIQYIEKLEDK